MLLSYEYVKSYIEKAGHQLLSTTYSNNREKMDLKCPEGHIYRTSYGKFQQGHRCKICSNIKNKSKDRLSLEFVKDTIEKEGYKLLSEYENNYTKIKMECPKKHMFEITFGNFQQGRRCQECFLDRKRLSYEEVWKFFNKHEYQLISKDYKNNSTKLEIICPEKHIFKMSFASFQQGSRCPVCNSQNGSSSPEKEVLSFIKSLLKINIIPNDRSQITNPHTNKQLELDIWIPELKKAIEFNGVHWHSTPQAQERDKIKRDQCAIKNIDLLIIEDGDWKRRKDKCIVEIHKFLGV